MLHKTKMWNPLAQLKMWGQPPSAVRPGKAQLLLIAVGAGLLWIALSTLMSPAQEASAAKPTADLPAGSMQAKATTACAECHEPRIILQQRLGKAAWTKEVDKMIKWGALVDPNDRDALIDYLSSNFGVDQPQYQPPRTSPEKKSSVQSK